MTRPWGWKSKTGRKTFLPRTGTAALIWWACSSVNPMAGSAQDGQVQGDRQTRPLVVASKPFAESYLLAEVFAQTLEAAGYTVDRRMGLGATELAFQALRQGQIDVYPEYTGTGLLAVLGQSYGDDTKSVFQIVEERFRTQWGVRWLPPLGFENAYAIAIRKSTADSLDLSNLSDLALRGQNLVGGFSPDFLGRGDGLPGLEDAYGLKLESTRALLQAVKYQALVQVEVDVIDGYSTDGAIDRFDLAVLEDDRGFFPPYDAAPLVSASFYRDFPRAVLALTALAGRLDVESIRGANYRIEANNEPVAEVARDLLESLDSGEATNVLELSDRRRTLSSFPRYLWERRGPLAHQTGRHMLLVIVSLGAAILVAVPLGVLLLGRPNYAEPVIRAVSMLQTIPGIALLAFMIPILGIGMTPAIVALFLYSLLPVLRNTHTGVGEADPGAVAAGQALGMTEAQVMTQIRLPLAAPIVMAGIRTAAVINVGTATLAAFIGAGGLGDPIVAGLALSDPMMILSGAAPAAALALVVDIGLGYVERRVTPKGLR